MAEKSLLDDSDGSSLLDNAKPESGSRVEGQIYIMRHGRTSMDMGANRSDGWLDFPLTDEGRNKLIPAQQLLKAVPISKIHAPDLLRTMETANIIKSGTMSDPKVEPTPEARTWNLGVLAGLRKEDGRPKVKELKLNPTKRPMGGESYSEFKKRFLEFFHSEQDEVEESPGDRKPLLVLSGSNLRLIGLELFGDESSCDLDEGGLACLHCVGGEWYCEVLLGHEDASPYES